MTRWDVVRCGGQSHCSGQEELTTSQTATRCCQAGRQSPSAAKVCRRDAYARQEETSRANPRTYSLRKEDLVVLRAKTCHHDPENRQERAEEDKLAEIAPIENRTRDDAHEEQQEALKCADPGHVGC
jgi:hypothetical protein